MVASPSHSPTRSRRGHDVTETTPLIASTSAIVDAQDAEYGAAKDMVPGKPLPKLQIFLLCYARVMEPIAFFSIFPFIAQMVKQNGHLQDSDVGFYSGLIESIFSFAQMLVLISWGRLADRIGRKPILICSLFGSTVGPALFGISTSIWQMILFRCFAGVFSASSLIIRTMIADHSTSETQARAFSWFAFAGNVGIFLGPLVGGALADPVNQYPAIFKGMTFLKNYPYALPGFAVAAANASAALLCILFLEETLKKDEPRETNSSEAQAEDEPEPLTTWELVKSPGVGAALWVYGHTMLLAFCFTALLPIFLWTRVSLGGIGLTTPQTSLYFGAQGASQAAWLLLVFPPLQRRIGTKGVLRACAAVYPFFFVGYIVMNMLLRDGSHAATVWFWIVGSVVCFIGPLVSMAFTAVQLSLNDASPSPRVLGTLNAIAMTCMSGIRCVAPIASTVLYAIGVHNQILWGHFGWVVLLPITLALPVALKWLPEDKKPAKVNGRR